MIRWLTTFSVLFSIAGFAIAAFVLLNVSYSDRQQAKQALVDSAFVLEREIDSQMLAWDFLLQKYTQSKTWSDVSNGKADSWQDAVLPGLLASSGNMGGLMILDSEGNVVDASPPLVSDSFNLADLDYFLVHKQRAEVGLYFSQPFHNSLRSGNMSIAISRRLSSEDGSFQGVVLGILPLTHFEHVFRNIELGPQGSITVFRLAGGIILHHLSSTSDVRIVPNDDLAAKASIRGSPVVVVVADGLDGMDRLHTLRRIGKLPLLVDVAVSMNGIPRAGRTAAVTISFILVVLSSLILALCRLLRREHARRLGHEAELVIMTCERFAHAKSSLPRRNAKLF